MVANFVCPDDETFRQFTASELLGDEAEQFVSHLEHCEKCIARLEKAPIDNVLVNDLGSGMPAAVDDTHLVELMSRLEKLAESNVAPATTPLTTDYSPLTTQPRIPERIGPYSVVEILGEGGMGCVYRVKDRLFRRSLAVKVLKEVDGADEKLYRGQSPHVRAELIMLLNDDRKRRFLEEAQLMGQLQHPGVPPVHDLGNLPDGRSYFAMKLIKGKTLAAMLKERTRPDQDLPQFLGILEQICQTLAYAHSRGIIHRDLKPANVMIGAFGEVQVMDWGLAKLLTAAAKTAESSEQESMICTERTEDPDAATQDGSAMGTPAYMAPEQARGEIDELDQRCDVFALGAILCEILTGQPPFTGKSGREILGMAQREETAAACARLEQCGADEELIDLANRCLAAKKTHRPAHAGVVAEAVGRYQAALLERMKQAEIDRAAALVRSAEERKRRRVSLALAAALLFLVVGCSGAAMWYQAEMARQDAERIQQDAERIRQEENKTRQAAELALRRKLLNKDVSAAVVDAVQRLNKLLKKLEKQNTVNELLSDVDLWHNKLKEAQAPFLVAKALAAGSPELVEQALTERLRKLEDNLGAAKKDWDFAKAWDEAQLAAATFMDGKWNLQAETRAYARIFAQAGLDVVHGDPDEIIDRIMKSPIRLVYLAALVHWADIEHNDRKLRVRLLAVANGADQDPWRKEFRNVQAWADTEKLQTLAREVDLQEQSPQLLLALARRLPKEGGEGAVLLRKTLVDHPRDFWISFQLGILLTDLVEQEGSFRTALAVRPSSSIAHNNLGFVLAGKKDVEGAISHYRKGIDLDPNDPITHNNLGKLLIDKKDYEGAVKHFRRVVDIKPDWPEAHNSLGIALQGKKDIDGASKCYRKALDIDPNLADAHSNLGHVRLARKDVEGAIKCYLTALALDPKLAAAHAGLGNALRDKKDLEGAIKCYFKALAIDANFAPAQNGLGVALLDKRDVEGAIKCFRKALDIDPNCAEAHINLGGALYYYKKDVEGAIKCCLKALAIDPNFAGAHTNLGFILTGKKDVEGAIKCYLKALAIDPNNAETHNGLGGALYQKKDVEGAIRCCLKALAIDPNFAKAHQNLGFILTGKKDVEGAIECFLKALAIDPNYAEAHNGLGGALYYKKDVEGAIKCFRTALAIDPNFAEAHNGLGSALYYKKDVEGAIKCFRTALAIDQNCALAHYNLGNALYRKKDGEGAIQCYLRALAIDPNYALAHYNLGNALRGKKDLEGAIKCYLKALDLDPNHADTHINLGIALVGKKDGEGAIQCFRKALAINPNHAGAQNNLAIVSRFLAQALLVKGQFADARTATLECLKMLPAGHPQRRLTQQLLDRCEQLLALDKQLSIILKGEDPPDNVTDLLAFADLCVRYKQYYAAATRFYARALEKEPKLAEDLRQGVRYHAACAASLAAAGKGKDADKLQEEDRARFRRQALDWLRADLALCRKLNLSGKVGEPILLSQVLPHWQRDLNLGGVREAKELARLPKDEQEAWQQVWVDVAQLLKEVRGRSIETQHQGTLTAKQTEQVHEVKMLADNSYIIDLESKQFNTYLRLEDVKGKILAENDDISPENRNSRLIFSPKEIGVYRIVATSFQQQSTGIYTLTIRAFAAAPATKDDPPTK